MGRRRPPALPPDRPTDLGRRRHLRHRRSQTALRELLQDAGAADRSGELRGAQRLTDPSTGSRRHGAGVVSGRRLDFRLHGFGAPGRNRVLRSRTARREAVGSGRILVGLLVQRRDLRLRDLPRHRRVSSEAKRGIVTARNRRGEVDPLRRSEHAGPEEDRVAGDAGRDDGIRRSAHTQQRHSAATREGGARGNGPRRSHACRKRQSRRRGRHGTDLCSGRTGEGRRRGTRTGRAASTGFGRYDEATCGVTALMPTQSTVPDRMSSPAVQLDTEFKRGLGLYASTMVVVGSMIGSGIFLVSAEMGRQTGSPGLLLTAWILTGVLTLAAALSYGELAAMMPRAGGQYVYLREAFSPLWGFLYGWTL